MREREREQTIYRIRCELLISHKELNPTQKQTQNQTHNRFTDKTNTVLKKYFLHTIRKTIYLFLIVLRNCCEKTYYVL